MKSPVRLVILFAAALFPIPRVFAGGDLGGRCPNHYDQITIALLSITVDGVDQPIGSSTVDGYISSGPYDHDEGIVVFPPNANGVTPMDLQDLYLRKVQ